MRRAPEFVLPRRREWSWWALVASVVAHVLVLSLRGSWYWSTGPAPEVQLIALEPGIAVVEMPWRAPTATRPTPRPPDEVDAPVSPGAPAPAEQMAAGEPGRAPAAAADTGPGQPVPEGPGRRGVPRLRPSIGEGVLWVRPLPLPPGELAQRITRSHYELVDSAVSEIVQAYIDSIIRAPMPYDNKPPSWVTTIGGKTFGIDSRNIYLGGLKIPSALLALLPIPSTSNLDLRYAQRMRDIQEDLQYAAQRARTMEDFKSAIKQLREQRQAEQEFERNQRRNPADTVPRTP